MIVAAIAAYIVVLFFQVNQQAQETASAKTLPSLTPSISYLDEDKYSKQMRTFVLPYIQKYEKTDFLQTEDGAKLRYKTYIQPDAKANIVISHGLCEFIEKYNELIYYFLISKYNVYILEDRGMGESSRYVDNKYLAHIDNFCQYVSDFQQFCQNVVKQDKPNYLYAHSMGGAVGACFMEDNPEFFEKAVLSSPMIKYSAGDIPNPLAKFFSAFMCFFGQSKEMCLGQGEYSTEFNYESSLDDSKARYTYVHTLSNDNENFQTSAPTYGWLKAASYDLEDMYKPENLNKIKTKCIVFKAGNDNNVKEYGEDHFANNVSNTKLYSIPDVKHKKHKKNPQKTQKKTQKSPKITKT